MFPENVYYDKNKKRKLFAGVLITGQDNILLGLKKTGFGKGLWNHSFAGKVEFGEEVVKAASRELQEESGLIVEHNQMEKVGYFEYEFVDKKINPGIMVLHIYRATSWSGESMESAEMIPRWWSHSDIPYTKMWPDNQFWLHHVLEGRKVRAYFLYNDCASIARHSIEVVEDLS